MVRSYLNYDRSSLSRATALECKDLSLTVQSQRDEADINVLVKRFGLTGVMPVSQRPPEYGDFSGIVDYRTALDAIRSADASFMEMPPDVRERFMNDPQRFLEFAMNPDNLGEMRKMGLAIPKVIEEAAAVPPVAVPLSVPPVAAKV